VFAFSASHFRVNVYFLKLPRGPSVQSPLSAPAASPQSPPLRVDLSLSVRDAGCLVITGECFHFSPLVSVLMYILSPLPRCSADPVHRHQHIASPPSSYFPLSSLAPALGRVNTHTIKLSRARALALGTHACCPCYRPLVCWQCCPHDGPHRTIVGLPHATSHALFTQ
jgi:hypothetical protein